MNKPSAFMTQALLSSLVVTGLILALNLNVHSMIVWDQDYWFRVVEAHLNTYPFNLRPMTTGALVWLVGAFGLSNLAAFIIIQYSLLFAVILSFTRLLRELEFSKRWCLVGSWLLAFCFPILGAHFEPNFTWDDFWGYLALIWMIIFLIRGKMLFAALALATVAITKENLLVALPALYFFRDRSKSPIHWIAAMALPIGLFVIYRLLRLGLIAHETASKFSFNFSDFEQSRQSVFSLLESFGMFWVFGALGIQRALLKSKIQNSLSPNHWGKLAQSALAVISLTVLSVFAGAYARETRLFFTPFVFLIPLGLWYLKETQVVELIKTRTQSSPVWLAFLIPALLLALSVALVTALFPNFPYLPMADSHRAYLALNLALVTLWYFSAKEGAVNSGVKSLAPILEFLRRPMVLLFAISFLIRLVFLLLVSENMSGDALWNHFHDTNKYLQIVEHFKAATPQGEEMLLLAGPGYAAILLVIEFFAQGNVWIHVAIQTIVSALSSVLLCQLALKVKLPSKVSYFAGYIHAISLSAIYLSVTMLTETWFVFFSLLTLVTFLSARQRNSTLLYCLAAVCMFATAMIRSLGQFYPLILVSLVFVPALITRSWSQNFSWRPLLFTGLGLFLILFWPIRNLVVNDIFTISETGTRAARLYWTASAIGGSRSGADVRRIRDEWEIELAELFIDRTPSAREMHDFDVRVVSEALGNHTSDMLHAYLGAAWGNITTQSVHHMQLAPQPTFLWNFYSQLTKRGLSKIILACSLLGALLLVREKKWLALATLGPLWGLFALTSGVTFWQGSRIYFPAIMAWAPLASLAVFWFVDKLSALIYITKNKPIN